MNEIKLWIIVEMQTYPILLHFIEVHRYYSFVCFFFLQTEGKIIQQQKDYN